MPKFLVCASYITYVSAEIEAEDLEEAKDIARNMDGGEFNRDGGDDWNIDSVEEVTE